MKSTRLAILPEGKAALRGRRRKTPKPSSALSAHRSHVEGLARIARRFAHSMNNVLAISRGNMLLARRAIAEKDLLEIIDDVLASLNHVDSLATNLAQLAHWREFRPQCVSLDEFFRMREGSLTDLLEGRHDLHIDLKDRNLLVNTDPDYLELALNAIIGNARDAMDKRGVIGIECHATHAETRSTGDGERFVSISVCDAGSGMKVSEMADAFDAGYSTKKTAHVGFGLWFVREFARASGGDAFIQRGQQGIGTIVSLEMPRITRTHGEERI